MGKYIDLYSRLIDGGEKLSVIGLGYVGMPIAVAFAQRIRVIGYDLNPAKIQLYKSGIDPTKEVGNDIIRATTVEFTSDEAMLRNAKFHIVAVPTPVYADHTPDLSPVEGASRILGRNLTKGSVIVFETSKSFSSRLLLPRRYHSRHKPCRALFPLRLKGTGNRYHMCRRRRRK